MPEVNDVQSQLNVTQVHSIVMPESEAANHAGYVNRYMSTGEAKIIGIGREMTARR